MKRLLAPVLAVLILFSAAGCGKKDEIKAVISGNGAPLSEMEAPPSLTVSCGHEEIQAFNPTFTWNIPSGGCIEADGLFVFDLWLNGSLHPLTAAENDRAELRFDAVPDRIRVMAWKAECATEDHTRAGESFDLPVKGDSFRIPIDGEYLYLIAAEWAVIDGVGGNAVYVFATTNGIE